MNQSSTVRGPDQKPPLIRVPVTRKVQRFTKICRLPLGKLARMHCIGLKQKLVVPEGER